ncbi:hypothetical protein CKJ90_28770, partial [Klebsiella pneumoniae]
ILLAKRPLHWGVDDPKNPNLPAWATMLKEAAQEISGSVSSGEVIGRTAHLSNLIKIHKNPSIKS